MSEEKKTDDDGSAAADISSGNILRSWNHSTADMSVTSDGGGFPSKAPLGSFEDSNVDDSPYEHGFQPGDHIIRWDMLPILWPIQIHGIVLEVSDDKTTVTICDFGITTVKSDVVEKKIIAKAREEKDVEKMLEEENAKFNEALQDEGGEGSSTEETTQRSDGVTNSASAAAVGKETKGGSKNRLNIVIMTNWSDLRRWKKVNYEGGLLHKGGGMGKGLEKLGKQTEKLWTSVTKSFVRKESITESSKVGVNHVPSVRHDVNDEGHCVHHPEIQLQRRREGDGDNGQDDWSVVRKKCPECILEDCPAMMGEQSPAASRTSTIVSTPTFSSAEEGDEESKEEDEGEKTDAVTSNLSASDSIQAPSGLNLTRTAGSNSSADEHGDVSPDVCRTDSKDDALEEPTLAQMIAEANKIDQRVVRKTVVKTAPSSPVKEQSLDKRSSWRHGSFMKSVSGLFSFSQETEKDEESLSREESASPSKAKGETGKWNANELPRSDPAVLVLARTRFILKNGEEVLPPYHIINSNSECIAVW